MNAHVGRTGPPIALAAIAIVGLLVMAGAIVATVAGDRSGGGATAAPSSTPATSGNAARQTAQQAMRALGSRSIQVVEPANPYRPAESPTLFSTPRLVLQAVLPDDPGGGQFVIYEFPTGADATSAGREYAAYIASGVGRVQFPGDARFVLRRIGTTLLFFTWSPANAPDARTADVDAALGSLGEPVPVGP